MWAQDVGHLWRTTGDINTAWSSIMSNYEQNVGLDGYSWTDSYNDPDMLEVGNGLNQTENKAHFSLWCIMDAPLIMGADVRNIDNASLSVLVNTQAIAVNQDPLTVQGKRV